MDIFEVTGYKTGIDRAGVNFLDPADAFEVIQNGFIYRQVLQSRLGFAQFGSCLTNVIAPVSLAQTTTAGIQTIIIDVLNDIGIRNPSIRSISPNAIIESGTFAISVNAGADQWDDSVTPGILTPIAGLAAPGTINYVTGQVILNFTAPVVAGLPITVSFAYCPGLRVMGIFEFTLLSGIKELLVFSKRYLYRWNPATDVFDFIPFSALILAANPIYNFNIANDDDYISGTSYPGSSVVALAYTPANRFVFTSRGITPVTGGTGVLFYDGTVVRDFFDTAVGNNPNAQQPAPVIGNISKATYLSNFGSRLNLFAPTTNVQTYNQGILYSGINDQSGSGDKYNTPGSGLLQADTGEVMKSSSILGDLTVLNFDRSSWSLEKTRDAFNPYFIRKIPSVLGTEAGFSAVQWNYEIKSAGKTGMITCDGRQNLRFDNKIPLVTADEFDQANFELTYGGFDRINGQFLFAYRDDESPLSSITQDKVLVYNYEESTWAINDQRFSVFGQTDVGQSLVWDDIDGLKDPSWAQWDDTEEVWGSIGVEAETQKTLAGDNDGFVYQINQDYDDYFTTVTGITNAPSAVLTIPATNFQVGDRVIVRDAGGMVEINNQLLTVIASTLTTITLNADSTLYGLYTGGGNVSKTIQFNAAMSPFNPYRANGRKVYVSHVEFLLNTGSSNLTVDFYEDEEQSPFKTVLLAPAGDSTANITNIVAGVSTLVFVDVPDFNIGEMVSFSGVGGMVELNGLIGRVTAVTNISITVNIKSTTFTAFTAGGSVQSAFSTTKQRQWITAIVDQESNWINIVMHNETTGNQTIVTSVRIHCSMGAYTDS